MCAQGFMIIMILTCLFPLLSACRAYDCNKLMITDHFALLDCRLRTAELSFHCENSAPNPWQFLTAPDVIMTTEQGLQAEICNSPSIQCDRYQHRQTKTTIKRIFLPGSLTETNECTG